MQIKIKLRERSLRVGMARTKVMTMMLTVRPVERAVEIECAEGGVVTKDTGELAFDPSELL